MQRGVEGGHDRGVAGLGAEGVGVAPVGVLLAEGGPRHRPAAGGEEAVEGVGDLLGQVVAAPVADPGEQEVVAGGPRQPLVDAGKPAEQARALVDAGPGEAGQVAGAAGAGHAGGVHLVVLHARQGELAVVGGAVGPVGRLDAGVEQGAGEGVALVALPGCGGGVCPLRLLPLVVPGAAFDEAGGELADGAPQGDVVPALHRGAGVAAQAASGVGRELAGAVEEHQGVAGRGRGAGVGLGPDAPGDAVLAPQAHQKGRVGFVPLDAHLPLGVAVAAEGAGVELEAAGQHRAALAPFAEQVFGDVDDALAQIQPAVAAGGHEGAGVGGFDEPGLQAAVELPRPGSHHEGVEVPPAAGVGEDLQLQRLAEQLLGRDVGPGGDAQQPQLQAAFFAAALLGREAVHQQRVGQGRAGPADAQA